MAQAAAATATNVSPVVRSLPAASVNERTSAYRPARRLASRASAIAEVVVIFSPCLRPGGRGEAWEDVKRIADINVRAVLATVTALLPYMLRRGSGQIALMSSLLAYVGMPAAPAYSASRAAVRIYGETVRAPLARHGILVNVVLPGFVKSDMSDQLPVAKLFMMSAESAARRIQRGLARNQARISFPWPLALACWSLSLLPPALSQRVLALLTARLGEETFPEPIRSLVTARRRALAA